ncbi:MAG: DinB family protein [Acidobacteriota bacterium]
MNRRKALRSIAAVGATAIAIAPRALAADVEVDIWVHRWELSKDYTMKVAEAMPADKYTYKPTGETSGDGARDFGGTMVHLAQAEGFYLGRFGKGAAPTAPKDMSKAVVTKYLGESFDWAIATIKQLTAADMTKTIAGGKGAPPTGLDLLLNAMIHTAHTRGYADMYLRNNGIKPPTYNVG